MKTLQDNLKNIVQEISRKVEGILHREEKAKKDSARDTHKEIRNISFKRQILSINIVIVIIILNFIFSIIAASDFERIKNAISIEKINKNKSTNNIVNRKIESSSKNVHPSIKYICDQRIYSRGDEYFLEEDISIICSKYKKFKEKTVNKIPIEKNEISNKNIWILLTINIGLILLMFSIRGNSKEKIYNLKLKNSYDLAIEIENIRGKYNDTIIFLEIINKLYEVTDTVNNKVQISTYDIDFIGDCFLSIHGYFENETNMRTIPHSDIYLAQEAIEIFEKYPWLSIDEKTRSLITSYHEFMNKTDEIISTKHIFSIVFLEKFRDAFSCLLISEIYRIKDESILEKYSISDVHEVLDYFENIINVDLPKTYAKEASIKDHFIVYKALKTAKELYGKINEQLQSANKLTRIFAWFTINLSLFTPLIVFTIYLFNLQFDETVFASILATSVTFTTLLHNSRYKEIKSIK